MMRYNEYAEIVNAELKATLSAINEQEVEAVVGAISEAGAIFCDGCGRSGFAINGFAMRLMHLGQKAYRVGDCNTPGIKRGDILFIGSGSGATSALVGHAQKAKEKGAIVVLVCIDEQSKIAAIADYVVVIPAPSPKCQRTVSFNSIQPMGALFEQSLGLLCDIMIMQLMEKMQKNSAMMFENHANLE